MLIASHDIYVDAGLSRVVPVGTAGAMCLRRAGERIPPDMALRYGIDNTATIRPADAARVRTAAVDAPKPATSPRTNGAPRNRKRR
jgi:hypothetical protein